MSKDNEKKRGDDQQQQGPTDPAARPGVAQSAPGPGVPPITSAPVQGQPASAFVQPAQTVPDGDPRFSVKDAGTPYVVGLGNVATNPTQYRNDQEKAAKDQKDQENKDGEHTDTDDSDENKRNNNS